MRSTTTAPQQCCRSCLTTAKPLVNLNDSLDESGVTQCNYLESFRKLAACGEDEAAMAAIGQAAPETICELCLDELRIAHAFRERCQRSSKVLLVRYRRSANLTTTVVTAEDGESGRNIKEVDGEQKKKVSEIEVGQEESEETITCAQVGGGEDEPEDEYMIEVLDECGTTNGEAENEEEEETGDQEEFTVGSPDGNSVVAPSESSKSQSQWTLYQENGEDCAGESSEILKDEVQEEEDEDENEQIVDEDFLEDMDQLDYDDGECLKEKSPAAVKTGSTIQLKCQECSLVFDNRLNFGAHMQLDHNSSLDHFCDECGIFCNSSIGLRRHMLQHFSADKSFICDICSKTFFSRNGLLMHMDTHKAGKTKTAEFPCADCGKIFTTSQRYRTHALTHSPRERTFACDLCDKSFFAEIRLRSHRRTHTGERPYHCNECGLRFAHSNALKCHVRTHTGSKPYKCEFCPKSFTQKTTLKTHQTLHTGKTVQCPDCDKKFSRPSSLILHRRSHTGEAPYPCTVCDRRYKQKSHLDRHMDTHLGVRHKCEVCGKAYSKVYTLNQHRLTHEDMTTWPFACGLCGEGFVRRYRYRVHMMKVHPELGEETSNGTDLLAAEDEPEEEEELEQAKLMEV